MSLQPSEVENAEYIECDPPSPVLFTLNTQAIEPTLDFKPEKKISSPFKKGF